MAWQLRRMLAPHPEPSYPSLLFSCFTSPIFVYLPLKGDWEFDATIVILHNALHENRFSLIISLYNSMADPTHRLELAPPASLSSQDAQSEPYDASASLTTIAPS